MQTDLTNKLNSLWIAIKSSWKPEPINKPVVDPQIESLHPLARSAESIRYSILSIEFWISRNGKVREWLRHNTRLAVWIAFPAFMILPIITFILIQLGVWVSTLVAIAWKLIVFPVLAFIAGLVTLVVTRIVKSLFGNR